MSQRGANRHRPRRFQPCKQQQKFTTENPPSGTSVIRDQVQNNPRPRRFHAHQQPDNIPIAMNAAEERARNSCNRRIPRTACICCGTTTHAQISAATPATKAPLLRTAARGEAISKCRRRYAASGSINKAATDIPQAGSQQWLGLSRGESRLEITR